MQQTTTTLLGRGTFAFANFSLSSIFHSKRPANCQRPFAQNRIQTAVQMFSPQQLQEFLVSYCQPCKMAVILTRISLFPIKIIEVFDQDFPISHIDYRGFFVKFTSTQSNFVIRNILVTLKLYLNVKCPLSTANVFPIKSVGNPCVTRGTL